MSKDFAKSRCQVCGQRSLKRESRLYEYDVSHDGRPPVRIRIPDLSVVVCTNSECRPDNPGDTMILDDAAFDRITVESYRQLGLLTPDEIRSKREALGLTQQQMQAMLGLGGNTMSRWEQGHVYQSRALDRMMRLFFASCQVRQMLAEEPWSATKEPAQGIAVDQASLEA